MKCANSRMFTIGRGTIGKHLLTIKDLIERSGGAPVPLATASTRWSPIVMGSVSLMADVVKARSMLINTKGLLGKSDDDDNTLVKAPCPRDPDEHSMAWYLAFGGKKTDTQDSINRLNS